MAEIKSYEQWEVGLSDKVNKNQKISDIYLKRETSKFFSRFYHEIKTFQRILYSLKTKILAHF